MAKTTDSEPYLSRLHKEVLRLYNFEEIKTLSFDLGVNYDDVPGDARPAFTRNLIVQLAKRGRLQDLVDHIRHDTLRPNAMVEDVPPGFELPETIAKEDIQQISHYHIYGDQNNVGSIENSTGVAIGRGVSVRVDHSRGETSESPTAETRTYQSVANQIRAYLLHVPDEKRQTADDLAASLDITMAVASAETNSRLHLNLLGRGQQQLATELRDDAPGIEQLIANWIELFGSDA